MGTYATTKSLSLAPKQEYEFGEAKGKHTSVLYLVRTLPTAEHHLQSEYIHTGTPLTIELGITLSPSWQGCV